MLISKKFTVFLLISAFFFIGLFTLPDYNLNWDMGDHAMRGQAYLHFFLTGNKDYSDKQKFVKYWQKPESLTLKSDIPKSEIVRRSVFQYDSYDYAYQLRMDSGHPPLSDILSSAFNVVLFEKLGLVNDIDSYRVYGILLASLLVGLIYWWVSEVYGGFAGFLSALTLSTYPLFWAHSHFNTEKDIPEAVYYSFFIFSVWKGVTQKSWKWILGSGLFLGLALGTKFNILFSVFIIIPWLLILGFGKIIKDGIPEATLSLKNNIRFIGCLILVPVIGISIFILTWPYLWQDVVANLDKVINYYEGLGLTQNTSRLLPLFGFNTYAVQTVIYSTPLIVLVLLSIGIVAAFYKTKKEENKTSMLVVLWFLVPIARVTLPGTNIHGGIRQIMEFIPAMAILAGLGGTTLKDLIVKEVKMKKPFLVSLAIVLSLLPIVATLIKMHPSEEFFFNSLIGGLSGAKNLNYPYWGENYGSPYRKAVEWINENAEYEAKVVFAFELMPNIPRIFFRPDLDFSNVYRSGYLRHGEYAITLIYQGVSERSYYDMYLEEFLEPVYQTVVDGVPILKVWKNDEAHLKNPWRERLAAGVKFQVNELGVLVDLGQVEEISRLEIDYGELNCSNKLSSGFARISKDSMAWEQPPRTFVGEWRISAMGEEPKNGKFIEPFVGQSARYIQLFLLPQDACLKNVYRLRVYQFE